MDYNDKRAVFERKRRALNERYAGKPMVYGPVYHPHRDDPTYSLEKSHVANAGYRKKQYEENKRFMEDEERRTLHSMGSGFGYLTGDMQPMPTGRTDYSPEYYRRRQENINYERGLNGYIPKVADDYRRYVGTPEYQQYHNQRAGEMDHWLSMDDAARGKEFSDRYRRDKNYKAPGLEGSWDYLTEEERGIYRTIYATEGDAAAQKYLDDMKIILNKRQTDEQNTRQEAKMENASGIGKVGMSLASIPGRMAGTVNAFANTTLAAMTGDDVNPYAPGMLNYNWANKHRELRGQEYVDATGGKEFLGINAGDVYGAAMSIGDMALGAATGAEAYAGLMGMGAAADEATRLYQEGASKQQIAAGSTLAGAAEMIFEEVSLDKLIHMKSPKNIAQIIRNTLVQGGIEGSEEVATEIANVMTNLIVMKDESDWNRLIEETGSEKEAFKQELRNLWRAFAGGALAGGPAGAVGSTVQYDTYRRTGKPIVKAEGGIEALGEIADEVATEDEKATIELAKNRYDAAAQRNQGRLRDKALFHGVRQNIAAGKYREAVMDSISNRDQEDLEKSLSRRGYSPQEAKKTASALVSYYRGQTLTTKQEETVSKAVRDKNIMSSVRDVILNKKSDAGRRRASMAALDVSAMGNRVKNRGKIQRLMTEPEKVIAEAVKANEAYAPTEELNVSDDGKAYVGDTAVEIDSIETVKDGQMTIKLKNGEIVALTDIQMPNREDAIVYEAVARIVPDAVTANKMIADYRGGTVDAATYAVGIQQAYDIGAHKLSSDELLKAEFTAPLSPAQRATAFRAGKKTGIPIQARPASSKASGKLIKLYDESKPLNKMQKSGVETAELLTKALGVDITVFESYEKETGGRWYKDENGKEVPAPHGKYQNGGIWVDINAGMDAEGAVALTLGHELTHFLREWNSEKFDVLAKIIAGAYYKNGESVNRLVQAQQEKAKRTGRTLSYDEAYEEWVADSMQTALIDGSVVQLMADIRAKDRTLWQKIKDWFKDLEQKLVRLRDAYKDAKPYTEEAQIAKNIDGLLGKLKPIFAEGLIEAADSMRATQRTEVGIAEKSLEKVERAVDAKPEPAKQAEKPVEKTAEAIEEPEQAANEPPEFRSKNGFTASAGTKEGFAQVSFDTKPAAEVLDFLKSKGFKWSQLNKVWQGPGNPQEIMDQLDREYTSVKESEEADRYARAEADWKAQEARGRAEQEAEVRKKAEWYERAVSSTAERKLAARAELESGSRAVRSAMEAEEKAKQEAREAAERANAEREAREKAEREAKAEADRKAKAEADRKAKADAEAKTKVEQEAKRAAREKELQPRRIDQRIDADIQRQGYTSLSSGSRAKDEEGEKFLERWLGGLGRGTTSADERYNRFAMLIGDHQGKLENGLTIQSSGQGGFRNSKYSSAYDVKIKSWEDLRDILPAMLRAKFMTQDQLVNGSRDSVASTAYGGLPIDTTVTEANLSPDITATIVADIFRGGKTVIRVPSSGIRAMTDSRNILLSVYNRLPYALRGNVSFLTAGNAKDVMESPYNLVLMDGDTELPAPMRALHIVDLANPATIKLVKDAKMADGYKDMLNFMASADDKARRDYFDFAQEHITRNFSESKWSHPGAYAAAYEKYLAETETTEESSEVATAKESLQVEEPAATVSKTEMIEEKAPEAAPVESKPAETEAKPEAAGIDASTAEAKKGTAEKGYLTSSMTAEQKKLNSEFGDPQTAQNPPMDAGQEARFSIRYDEKYMGAAAKLNDKYGHVSPQTLKNAAKVRSELQARMQKLLDAGKTGIPQDIEGNTFFADSSYGGSEENTTICPRSLASEAFVDAVSDMMGRPLTVAEQIQISQFLQGSQLAPECPYCYVATDRKAYREFMGKYLEQRDAVIGKLKAGAKDMDALYEEFLDGRKPTKPMRKRFDMWVNLYKGGKPMVSAAELANMQKLIAYSSVKTVSGTPDVGIRISGSMKEQVKDAMRYAQSASWAKKRVSYVAYNGHILRWKPDRINKLNSHYGLRMYSFSDFSPAFILENMQMITDAAVRGLKMLAYTKDTDFAEIFAPTGININISVFGFQKGNGVEAFENNRIGAEWEKAKALREKYPNVGVVFVATNDFLTEWAMKQPWIDVVIPYHLVRTGTEVAKAYDYINYTSESADTKRKNWKGPKSGGTDISSIPPTMHNNDKLTYANALRENHLNPRFKRYWGNPNYMKLVNECRLPASLSQPVQPIFDTEEQHDAIERAMAKLEANGYYTPVGGSEEKMWDAAFRLEEAISAGKDVSKMRMENLYEDGAKLSARDSAGNELSEEQQEFFKDSKVRDAEGRLIPVYHGTPNEFTIFDQGTAPGWGRGIYLTDNKSETAEYGGRVIEAYANIKNPFYADKGYESVEGMDYRSTKAYQKHNHKIYDRFYDADYDTYEEYVEEFNGGAKLYDIYEEYVDVFNEILRELGFDGIIADHSNNIDGLEIVAFSREQIKNISNRKPTSDPDIRYSARVTDQDTIDFLEKQSKEGKVYHTYRSMQLIDGKLYPPMGARVNGKYEDESILGQWEEAVEHPELATPDGKFKLDKGKGEGSLYAAYNPYMHSSNLVLNDQFTGAWHRGNLVTIEAEVPMSEEGGTYHADRAKDATGWHDWHSGTVAGGIRRAKGIDRKVYLSRWLKPIRIVPDSEVAQKYKEALEGTDVEIPDNVVPPNLLKELKKIGVPIKVTGKTEEGKIKYSERDPSLERANRVLKKENEKLREDVKRANELVKLQGKLTGGKMMKRSSLEAVARRLAKMTDSKASPKEVADGLSEVYSYIASGNEVTWEGIEELASPVADLLISGKRFRRGQYAQGILDSLKGRKVKLNKNQTAEAISQYGSIKDFRRAISGTVILSEEGTSLDSLWQELSSEYPDKFDSEETSGNQPTALAAVVEDLKDTSLEDEWGYAPLEKRDIVRSIYDGYWDAVTLLTVADRKQETIDALKADVAEGKRTVKEQGKEIKAITKSAEKDKEGLRKDLEKQYRTEIAELRKQHKETMAIAEKLVNKEIKAIRQENREALKEVRKDARAKVEETAKRYQESRARNVEGRKKTAVRAKIKKVVGDLQKILLRGNRQRNVKAGMQDYAYQALATAEIIMSGELTDDVVLKAGEFRGITEEQSKLLNRLRDLDADITNYPAAAAPGQSLEDFIARRDKLIREKAKVTAQLKPAIEAERRAMGKATFDGAFGQLAEAYHQFKDSKDDYIKQAYREAVYGYLRGMADEAAGTPLKDMSLSQLESIYRGYKLVMESIRKANEIFADGKAQDLQTWVDNVQGELAANEVPVKDRPAAVADALDRANEFTWNALAPVDAFNRLGSESFTRLFWGAIDSQNRYGSFVSEIADAVIGARQRHGYAKFDLKTAKPFELEDGKIFRLNLEDMMSIYAYSKRPQAGPHMTDGGFAFDTGSTYTEKKNGVEYRHHKLTTPYRLSEQDISDILTEFLKHKEAVAYVDELQKFMTEFGSKYGNEASRTLWGINLFEEEMYFPLMSETDYRSSVETAMQANTTQVSLANAGMTKKTTPGAHNPIVLKGFDDVVLEHLDKMAKYSAYVVAIDNLQKVFNATSDHGTGDYISTQAYISSIYGEAARKYIDQYITDLNGGGTASGAQNPLMRFFGRAKGVQVAANLSVVIQQYSAIIRAMAEIDPQYFVPNSVSQKAAGKLYDELKKYAPVAVIKEMGGFDIGSMQGLNRYIGTEEAPMSKELVKKKVDDIFGWGPELMDKLGWLTIWQAVKHEASKTTSLKPGSEEFLEHCGRRFTEVVTKTQVYNSVNSRSGFMRSKHDSTQFLTSFMGEPTRIVGMAYTAGNDLARAIRTKKGIKEAAQKAARTGAAMFASMIANAMLKALPYAARDDDDEEEAYLEKWIMQFGSSVRNDMNPLSYLPVFRDLLNIWQGWDIERPDVTLAAGLILNAKRLAKALQDGTATPEHWLKMAGDLGNAIGFPAKNIIREAEAFVNFWSMATDDEVPNDMGGAFRRGISGDRLSKQERLYEAIMDGNQARIDAIRGTYKTENAYHSELKKLLRENDPRITEAAEAYAADNPAEYQRIFREVQAEGKFAFDDIMGAIQYVVGQIKPEDGPKTPEDPKKAAFYQEYGYRWSSREDLYAADGISAADLKKSYMAIEGKTAEEAEAYIQKLDYEQQYPDIDVDSYLIDGYNKYAKPYGIGFEDYAAFREDTSEIKSTEKESRREQILHIIDSMPISRQQKDGLYFAAGYKDSTLDEAPWH